MALEHSCIQTRWVNVLLLLQISTCVHQSGIWRFNMDYIAILVCSIYFTLVTKLCGCFSRRRPWIDRWCFLLEHIFVMITLLAGLVFSVLAYYNILYHTKLWRVLRSNYCSHTTTCNSTNKLHRKRCFNFMVLCSMEKENCKEKSSLDPSPSESGLESRLGEEMYWKK